MQHINFNLILVVTECHLQINEKRSLPLSPPVDFVDVDIGAVPPTDADAIVLEQLLHQLLLVKSLKPLNALNLILDFKAKSTIRSKKHYKYITSVRKEVFKLIRLLKSAWQLLYFPMC